jgi:hypothetical protein
MSEQIDLDKRIGQYVALRDKIKTIEEKHKAELAPYKDALGKLGDLMLHHLNSINTDSTKSTSGTVYRTMRKSASIADGDQFRRYVIGSEAFELIDWRANAPAVASFIEENGVAPPGVNYTTTFTVGVRRGNGS